MRLIVILTDASQEGFGAILSQKDPVVNALRPVYFASRRTPRTERNKRWIPELEAAAIFFACQKFNHFISGFRVTVLTDHSPLPSMYRSIKPTGNQYIDKWFTSLKARFDLKLEYFQGKLNTAADCLSRAFIPRDDDNNLSDSDDDDEVPLLPLKIRVFKTRRAAAFEAAKKLLDSTKNANCNEIPNDSQNSTNFRPIPKPRRLKNLEHINHPNPALITHQADSCIYNSDSNFISIPDNEKIQFGEMIEIDRELPFTINLGMDSNLWIDSLKNSEFGHVYNFLVNHIMPDDKEYMNCSIYAKVQNFCILEFHDVSILFFITPHEELRLCVPPIARQEILSNLHKSLSHWHFAGKKLYQTLKLQYYWPSMRRDCTFISEICENCAISRRNRQASAPLKPFRTNHPFELLCVDTVDWGSSHSGPKYAVIFVDHFSKFVISEPLRNKSANEMAAVLFTRVLAIHGCPESIHSDKGTEFTNKLVAELAQLMGVKRFFTAGYNPRANGLAERFVWRMSEIMQRHKALGGICEWPELLSFVVFAHNISPFESSSYSPFHLMYGRQPVWPEAPIIMEKYPFYTQDIDTYLQLYLEYYHEIVQDAHLNLEKSRGKMKETFDRKREVFKNDKFHVDDLVYLMKLRSAVKRSKDKLLPKVYGPYLIDKIFDTTANLIDFKDKVIGKFPLDRLIKIPKSLRTPCVELKDKSVEKSNLIITKFHARLNLNNHCLKTIDDDFMYTNKKLFTAKGPSMHLQGLRPPTDGLTVDDEIETQLRAEADKCSQEMAKATREARSIADRLRIEANNKMKAAIAIENELKLTLPTATIFGGTGKREERAKVELLDKNTNFHQFIIINNKTSGQKSLVKTEEYESIDDLYFILFELNHNIEIGVFFNLKEAKTLRQDAGTLYWESVEILRNTDLQKEKMKASLETPKSSKQSTSNEILITKVVSGVATKRPNEAEVITIDEPPTKVRKQSNELDPEGYKIDLA